MKIATWNVNSIRTRQDIVANWLQQNSIDILCLQETKVIDKDFPCTRFEELGYHVYISGQKAYNGVAIFSLMPLTEVSAGFTPILGDRAEEFDLQKRVITGVVGNIRLVNLYVPNGADIGDAKYKYKLQWLKLLKEYLYTLQTKETHQMCVCGDFNIALEDRDIYNSEGKETHIMFSLPEREALQEVLSIGLEDVFRKFSPESGHFSWWNYRFNSFQRDRGWLIDRLYLTSELYQKATNCWIDREPRKLVKPSDHAPVIVEILS